MVSLSIPKNSFIFSGVIGPITGQWANNSPTTSHWSLQNILDYKELQSFDGAQTFAKRCKKLSEWDYSLCFSANNQQPTHLRIDTMNYDKCIKKKIKQFFVAGSSTYYWQWYLANPEHSNERHGVILYWWQILL